MNKIKVGVCFALCSLAAPSMAQYMWQEEDGTEKIDLREDIQYGVEMQGSFSKGKTPLWLNANKHGLSSLEKNNGYLRGSLVRPLSADSARRWAVGYGVDVAVPVNYTSHVVVQQAYVEARWLYGVLTAGAKEYPMELKNQSLSSGSQCLGINARPIPQVRLALPEYWTLPFGRGWLQLKGHLAYGMTTDDGWQHDFTKRQTKYCDHMLYHSKAGFLRIGNENAFFPLSIEMGLEMVAQFGGNAYRPIGDSMVQIPTEKNLKGFWHALSATGSDAGEGAYANVASNQLGSWLMRINYDTDSWKAAIYADHYFEDHSQMFLLDYNGYGEGVDWNKKVKRRFFMYSLKDIMLGFELNLKYSRWLKNVVLEYLYTKYQSGPYNHDRTSGIADHIAGTDDYYNHSIYPGWQHWGQVIGNPLYRSPIYNNDGCIDVRNNRFIAYHLGFDGQPTQRLGYRILGTYQKGWGTYSNPFTKKHHNVSFLVEGHYDFPHQWQLKAGYAMDFGSEKMLGHNAGMQITISKRGLLTKRNNNR